MTARNARFWIWHNDDWCKLTLRPGQTITILTGGNHEEGYGMEAESYSLAEDGIVTLERTAWGRDCDGGYEHWTDLYCHVHALKGNPADENGPARPTWLNAGERCRDEYAELAGY